MKNIKKKMKKIRSEQSKIKGGEHERTASVPRYDTTIMWNPLIKK